MFKKYLIENCGFTESEVQHIKKHPVLVLLILGAVIGLSFVAYTLLVTLLLAF